MRIVPTISGIALAAAASLPASACACEAAGANTHISQGLQVDRGAGSFSILDAEQMTAIRFSAAGRILDKVDGTDRMAIVNYEETDGGLKATRVALR